MRLKLKSGKIEGIVNSYNRNGILIYKWRYKNGLKHGKSKILNPDGSLRGWEYFKNGILNKIIMLDKEGNKKRTTTFKDGKIESTINH